MSVSSLTDLISVSLPVHAIVWLGRQALIGAGVLTVAALAARRAHTMGISPSRPTNQILLGLLVGLPISLHLLLSWHSSSQAAEPPPGHGWFRAGLIVVFGLLLAALAVLRRRRLPLLTWLDVCAPATLLGLAVAHLASGLGATAQAGDLTLIEGLLPPLATLGALLWAERRASGALPPGDSALLCGVLYTLGYLITAGLRAPLDQAHTASITALLGALNLGV